MANDTDIFGDVPSNTLTDADIFKDLPGTKTEEAIQSDPVKTMAAQDKGMADFNARPWGSGVSQLAYDVGGKLTDLTGSPILGASINAIPDFLQMAMGGFIGKSAAPVLEGAGKILMQSALKPTVDQVKRGRAAPAVQTMLDEGFNPTAGGVEKMKSTLGDLGGQVDEAISKSGAQVDVHSVADYVRNAYDRFKNGPMAVQAIDDLGKVQSSLLQHPNVAGSRTIPVQVAQDMKSGYQRAVGDKGYGELKTAVTEGEKQVARGFREKIGEAVPGVVEPLAREASIINALKMAERRVAVDANKNPIGLGWLGQPWMLPFWLWDRSAGAKALTARGLYSGSEMIPGAIGAGGGVLSGAMQPGGVLNR